MSVFSKSGHNPRGLGLSHLYCFQTLRRPHHCGRHALKIAGVIHNDFDFSQIAAPWVHLGFPSWRDEIPVRYLLHLLPAYYRDVLSSLFQFHHEQIFIPHEGKFASLVDGRATKTEVIEQLGKPVKYRETSMSYRACRKPFVGWAAIVYPCAGIWLPEDAECFELQLNFNQDGHLAGYQKRPWPTDFNFLQESMRLKEFANEGDPVAAKLWL